MLIKVTQFTFFIFCLVFIHKPDAHAQTRQDQVRIYNTYVDFLNESVHGLLIVHRLMENFNQSINKYVDLEGYQLNFYANSDLPRDIFVDPERWFYDVSPVDLYAEAIRQSRSFQPREAEDLNVDLEDVKALLSRINSIRFSVEDYIESHDLNDREQLYMVYEMLEDCVAMYEQYFNLHEKLTRKLITQFGPVEDNSTISLYYLACRDIRDATFAVLLALRKKEDNNFDGLIRKLIESYARFKKLTAQHYDDLKGRTSNFDEHVANIEKKCEDAIQAANLFYEAGDVPEEYKLYGKYYYYHNSNIINKVNRYGNGFIFEMNEMSAGGGLPFMKFTEIPHFYQVIYPQRLDTLDHISSMDPFITRTPEILRDRQIVQSDRVIYADSLLFEVELYDHMIQDGDIVSINFNGDWILDNFSIGAKSKVLKLKLNDIGKNFLLLHAENLGKRPPNTMAIRYYSKGIQEDIVLKADMKTSEIIEIVLQE